MKRERPPEWFDRAGMQAWAEGMASATQRGVRIVGLDETELLRAGQGEGDPDRFLLEVNGQKVGWLELSPGIGDGALKAQVLKAIETFHSLAEVRNSMADLVRTTARQWREMSVLYRSTDLMRVDQGSHTLASNLLQQATRALRTRAGAVRHHYGDDLPVHVTEGDEAEILLDVAEWGEDLDEGVVVNDPAELERLGFSGDAPDSPFLIVPMRGRGSSFGSLALLAREGRVLSVEDLKLAALLSDQAGRAYDNLRLVDQARDSERLQKELEVAAEIQDSILPPANAKLDWLEFAGVCSPAKWVGGDAFIFDEQSDEAVLTGVADVCGHGISSAMLMNAFASSIHALSMTQVQPGRLLEITNDLLAERVGSTGMFVTAVLMRLQTGGKLTLASAGHPDALLVSVDGTVQKVDCGDLPLGVFAGSAYEEVALDLQPGGTVVAYSDGVTEARSPDGTMYGEDRLVDLLGREAPNATSCSELRVAIMADLSTFRDGQEQDDDVTVVVLRRTE